jgi:pyruvate ferredoxin oxidoreductase gamma subunit
LGTAAFQAGLEVQDFPVYGAERRGAALAAFTRISTEPIRERGVITHPDLIVIADETLLADPSAGVLSGAPAPARSVVPTVAGASAVFVNSPAGPGSLGSRYAIPCTVHTLDLTALTLELLARGSALSTPLGAAACALTGLISEEWMIAAVREELTELHLLPEVLDRNVALARRVYAALPTVPLCERPAVTVQGSIHTPTYDRGPAGVPAIFATGNSPRRHTGSWRLFRPEIDRSACTRCLLCLIRCPDAAITLDARGYPVIDYDNCKGCLICAEECPVHCISEQQEVRAW